MGLQEDSNVVRTRNHLGTKATNMSTDERATFPSNDIGYNDGFSDAKQAFEHRYDVEYIIGYLAAMCDVINEFGGESAVKDYYADWAYSTQGPEAVAKQLLEAGSLTVEEYRTVHRVLSKSAPYEGLNRLRCMILEKD